MSTSGVAALIKYQQMIYKYGFLQQYKHQT